MEAVEKSLQQADIVLIVSGIVMGTFARIITLHVDYRQNPSYPGGFLINMITGFVASVLGAVAIPALLAKNFTAVTFLTIGVQQFREIRKLEIQSLSHWKVRSIPKEEPLILMALQKRMKRETIFHC